MKNNQEETPITPSLLLEHGFVERSLSDTVYYEKKGKAVGCFFGKWIVMTILNGIPYFTSFYVNSLEELNQII